MHAHKNRVMIILQVHPQHPASQGMEGVSTNMGIGMNIIPHWGQDSLLLAEEAQIEPSATAKRELCA